LRAARDQPAALFTYHKAAITSVEWDSNEESTLAVCSADNSVTIWDLSLEKDDEEARDEPDFEVPPQLLFVHMVRHSSQSLSLPFKVLKMISNNDLQGMKNMKELHWHPQIPDTVVCTAEDGLNVFKPDLE
jgi:ribosome assembly protein RRB1